MSNHSANYTCDTCGSVWRNEPRERRWGCKNCGAPCVPDEPEEPELRLKLIVDVDYKLHGETPEHMRTILDRIPAAACDDGMMTNGSDSEVNGWSSSVQILGTDSPSALLTKWLGAVNQPVAEDVIEKLKELLVIVSDDGSFEEDQCKNLLIEILTHRKVKLPGPKPVKN